MLNLKTIAYNNKDDILFSQLYDHDVLSLSLILKDDDIFLSYSSRVKHHLQLLKSNSLNDAHDYVSKIIEVVFVDLESINQKSENWHRSIFTIAQSLYDEHYIVEANKLMLEQRRLGVDKYPRLELLNHSLSLTINKYTLSSDELAMSALTILSKPYKVGSLKEVAQLTKNLVHLLGNVETLDIYDFALWHSFAMTSLTGDYERVIYERLINKHRGRFRALILGNAGYVYKFIFLISIFIKSKFLSKILFTLVLLFIRKKLMKDFVFYNNKFFAVKNNDQKKDKKLNSLLMLFNTYSFKNKVLVTRAMGGLGDILMMTSALTALARKSPKTEVYFATQLQFHKVLKTIENENIKLLDINDENIDVCSYNKWVNWTNCPASRYESKNIKNVKLNRIEIFAKSLGVSRRYLKKNSLLTPVFKNNYEDILWAKNFLLRVNHKSELLVCIQPFAADTYRNWPHVFTLVRLLSTFCKVFVLHNSSIDEQFNENVFVINESVGRASALIELSNYSVVLDSSLLHISAALNVPTIAIFGAISGKTRTQHYKNVMLLNPDKSNFPCYPCWRNEYSNCKFTTERESLCLRSISPEVVFNIIKNDDFTPTVHKSNLIQRILYGNS